MKQYQVTARKYRPQLFKEILAQDSIVTTLKNGIKFNRIAHAYLFSGPRGTGKTTTARVFAKAINCEKRGETQEPCNCCTSCKEIAASNCLDVLEIDGASHRGIEHIRQINETVGYAASSGHYKIYIIDEVHMLTKEAFNALLKTLEEPPQKVIFLFATTESHKIPATILSRCQRFNLQRISNELIVKKLQFIADSQKITIQNEAFLMIANKAEGCLRDAESLFDQIIAFHEGEITAPSVASILGVVSREIFLELDQAGKSGNFLKAFEITEKVFSEGKDLTYFLEELIDHFRTLLLIKLGANETPLLLFSSEQKEAYLKSSKLYSQEQLMTIQEFLLETQQNLRFAPSLRIAIESLLLKIIRSHRRIPIELLVKRLSYLENSLTSRQATPIPLVEALPRETQDFSAPPKKEETVSPKAPIPKENVTPPLSLISEDPTPTQNELPPQNIPKQIDRKKQSRYDTLLHFAAIELEGTIRKK